MRILLLTQFYPPIIGGEERHVRNLALGLASRGHQVSVATQAAAGERSHSASEGQVTVHRLAGTARRLSGLFSEADRPHVPPIPDPELAWGLRKILRLERPDIVHAHNWMLHSYLPLKRSSGVPLVVTLHDYSLVCPRKTFMHGTQTCTGSNLPKCLKCARHQYGLIKGGITTIGHRIEQPIEHRAVDRFLAVSRAVARLNQLGAHGTPFEVVPNFIPDAFDCSPEERALADRTLPPQFMLFAGDLSVQKGINVLLDAYARLDKAPPLVLVGRSIPGVAEQLPPNVLHLDRWPHGAVIQAFRKCLFALAPSIWHEPCATVVMEAMAQGRPMIVTDMGGMPDLVQHGVTGLVVPAGDSDQLADAMRTLLAEPQMVARMSTACLKDVERFRAATVVARIEAIYREMLLQRAAA
jgi:glycosyltransferase involved in cell wall biosynthesis